MKFTSSSGPPDVFELAIDGYGCVTSTWRDRNRLQCRFSMFREQKSDSQSLLLHTWEVKRLLSGLRLLWTKAARRVTLTFSEPGLCMEAKALTEDEYCLQIQLDHALTPSWHRYPGFPVEMTIFLDRNQLREAIRELSNQMEAYPER